MQQNIKDIIAQKVEKYISKDLLSSVGKSAEGVTEDLLGIVNSIQKDSNKPYGDVHYADPGLQSDGKHRYPIDNAEHIRAAWNYINHPDNAGKYSSEDLHKVRNAIISAWKDKIDPKGPESAEKKTFVNTTDTISNVTEDSVSTKDIGSPETSGVRMDYSLQPKNSIDPDPSNPEPTQKDMDEVEKKDNEQEPGTESEEKMFGRIMEANEKMFGKIESIHAHLECMSPSVKEIHEKMFSGISTKEVVSPDPSAADSIPKTAVVSPDPKDGDSVKAADDEDAVEKKRPAVEDDTNLKKFEQRFDSLEVLVKSQSTLIDALKDLLLVNVSVSTEGIRKQLLEDNVVEKQIAHNPYVRSKATSWINDGRFSTGNAGATQEVKQ